MRDARAEQLLLDCMRGVRSVRLGWMRPALRPLRPLLWLVRLGGDAEFALHFVWPWALAGFVVVLGPLGWFFGDYPLWIGILALIGAVSVAPVAALGVFKTVEQFASPNVSQGQASIATLVAEFNKFGVSFEVAHHRLRSVNASVDFSIHATDRDIRTRGLMLRVYDVHPARFWQTQERALIDLQPSVAPKLNAPRTLEAAGEPWSDGTYFDEDLTKDGGIRFEGRITCRLVLVTDAPPDTEFLSRMLETKESWEWES